MSSQAEASPGGLPTLYRHQKRKKWGYAVLAAEEIDRRTFHFEDGRRRTFKIGWYELMKPMDQPDAETVEIARRLAGELGQAETRARHVDVDIDSLLTLNEQIDAFKKAWPEGFDGERWLADVRGRGSERPLKRHREPVMQRAADQLTAERLTGADLEGPWTDVLALLASTDIVSRKTDVAPMEGATPERRAKVLEALSNTLHGTGDYAQRLDAYVDALTRARGGTPPSWPLATVLQGLAKPEHHVPVRASAFRDQAHWSAPRLKPAKDPRGKTYVAFLNMAFAVQADIERAGLSPADHMDVYEFIRRTRTRKVGDTIGKRP